MPDATPAGDVQATFCATLVDEWARGGVTVAVVAPGSRSTPLALALLADPRIRLEIFHDERAAAFCALGVGLASGSPAVLLCTSGTAAAHFHAAVIEADLSCVPVLVCTADRPTELRDSGAPQAIDQTRLYGNAVRWFADPGVANSAAAGSWRALAARAVVHSVGHAGQPAGPVHLNLPFREPLVGTPAALPPGREGGQPWTAAARAPAPAPLRVEGRRIVVIGGRPGDAAGWPHLAAATSTGPGPGATTSGPAGANAATPNPAGAAGDTDTGGGPVIAHADAILRDGPTAARLQPDVIVRIGRPPASRIVDEWVQASGARLVVLADRWADPGHQAALVAPARTPLQVAMPDPEYAAAWAAADAAASKAIDAVLAGQSELTEPGAVRAVLASVPAGGHLVVASSMPVRDLEWYAPRREDVHVHANRGANGIDGTLATAIGVAMATGEPVTVVLGDVAFLHDSTALIGLKAREVALRVVVIDNDGGGIFSFLPQAAALAPASFERLFGTPHGVRPDELAAAYGIASLVVEVPDALGPALDAAASVGGVWLVVVRSDRAANVVLHRSLNDAVAAALASG